MINITFSTCWYNFKAKFNLDTYYSWIDNMLTNVNNYYLVIYTDDMGFKYLQKYASNNIVIVNKPYTEFYNYKYKDYWISNHAKNKLLNSMVDWRVNMLWSEKVHFVHETMKHKYFETEFYGWCDIGYFRNRSIDIPKHRLKYWPNNEKISKLNKNKVYYGLINNNSNYINSLYMLIQNKNSLGLPSEEIPSNQLSIAGGFFMCHKDKVEWWKETYNKKLYLYFENNCLVKDDQIIVIDCIFSSLENFVLQREDSTYYDNWFLFQRYLL